MVEKDELHDKAEGLTPEETTPDPDQNPYIPVVARMSPRLRSKFLESLQRLEERREQRQQQKEEGYHMDFTAE